MFYPWKLRVQPWPRGMGRIATTAMATTAMFNSGGRRSMILENQKLFEVKKLEITQKSGHVTTTCGFENLVIPISSWPSKELMMIEINLGVPYCQRKIHTSMTKKGWSASSWENENLDLVELIKDIPADANIAYVFSLNHDAYVGSCWLFFMLYNSDMLDEWSVASCTNSRNKKVLHQFLQEGHHDDDHCPRRHQKILLLNQWTSLGERKSPRFLSWVKCPKARKSLS